MRNEKPVGIEGEKMNTNGAHHAEDEADSETSFGDEHVGFLDRLGMKMDDRLHRIFTGYVFLIFLSHEKFIYLFSIGRFCAYNPAFTIIPVVVILLVLCFGSRYYTVTTDPVDLWVASSSRARLEKAYFDEKFG